jgi:hypothetical protein
MGQSGLEGYGCHYPCMIHFIHGIRTEPTSPVKGLVAYLVAAGLEVTYPDYGYELAIETRVINGMIEGTLLHYIKPGDILIGHSNGCAIAYHLLLMGAPAVGAVFINGALETNIVCPGNCQWLDVYWNAGDDVTEIAKVGEELGIYDGLWGDLGHAGYSGSDPAISSFNCGATINMPAVSGHSDFFTPDKLKVWGPYLAGRIKAKLQ